MRRHDYAFPLRIDPLSREGARAGTYDAHVAQMIRQVLLTSAGERTHLPQFGCGLRRLLFAPASDALAASTQLLVTQSLTRWLSDHIEVKRVEVESPSSAPDESQLLVRVEYVLRETRTTERVEVRIP